MRRGLWLLSIATAAACGSRTGLLVDVGRGSGGGSGATDSGSNTTPQSNGCTAALQPGAPTPMRGYCPTGAGLAPVAAPRGPSLAWKTTLVPGEDPKNVLPLEIVVDASGRAFVGVYSSPLSPTARYEIVAIDPDGTLAWRVPLAAPPAGISFVGTPTAGLAIGSDGTIWGATDPSADWADAGDAGMTSNQPAVLLGIARDGSVARRIQVAAPPNLLDSGVPSCGGIPCGPTDAPDAGIDQGPDPADFAVSGIQSLMIGSDGSYYVLASSVEGFFEPAAYGIARIRPDGSTVWAWSDLNYLPQSPLYLTPGDDVVTTTSRGLTADDSPALLSLTAQGAGRWLGDASQVEILGPDGNAVGITQTFPGGELTVTRLDARGQVAMRTSLGAPSVSFEATHLAVAKDGTILVLLAQEASAPGDKHTEVQLLAVDPRSGATRWTSTFDFDLAFNPSAPAGHFGVFVDPGGTIVLTAGVVRGVDLATGSTLWTVPPPSLSSCLQPAVLGANGSILAAQCDGTVFMARDP